MTPEYAAAAQALRDAEAIQVTAGAGMGVDSGLPDFRGNEGFWNAYPPFARLGLGFVDLANPEWFRRDPALAWGFYGHRLDLYRRTEPHAGFGLLLAIAAGRPTFAFTSNVDGHFQRSGFAGVAECHGSLNHLQCADPCSASVWSAGDLQLLVDPATFRAAAPFPTCPECGGIARPNVLMFGDGAWLPARTQAQEMQLSAWLAGPGAGRLAVVEIGAGLAIPTVRRFGERLCSAVGKRGRLIRINPRDADVPGGQIGLPVGALEGIRGLVAALGIRPPAGPAAP